MPEVTVLMSVYKESHDVLKQAIDSILNQTFTDFEYIIVYDAPDYEPNKILLQNYAAKNKKIKLHFNEKNQGLAASLNNGLKEASGTYIARMDADDIAYPERIETQLNYLKENNLDFTGCYVKTIYEDGKELQKVVKVPVTHKKIVKTLKINNCIFHPTWFLKKEVFDKIGGYYGAFAEDYMFILEAMKRNYKFGNVPEVLLKYRMGKSSISRSNLFLQYICMCYLQKKYFSHKVDDTCLEFYLIDKFTEEKQEKFVESSNYLTDAIHAFKAKHLVKCVCNLNRAFFGSKEYRRKMVSYLRQFLV